MIRLECKVFDNSFGVFASHAVEGAHMEMVSVAYNKPGCYIDPVKHPHALGSLAVTNWFSIGVAGA